MPRQVRRALVTISGIALLIVAAFIPVFPGAVTYRSVLDAPQSTSVRSLLVSSHETGVETHDLYALHEGVLHLRCQSTRSAVVLVTGVSFTYWPLSTLADFRAENPNLERYWPDPAAPNAGVAWAPTSAENDHGRACR